MEKYNCGGWEYYIENDAANILGIPESSDKELIVPETLDGYRVEEVKFYFANTRGYSSIKLSKNIKRFDAVCIAETIESIFVDSDNEYFLEKDGILYSKDGKTLVSFPPARRSFDTSCLTGVEIIGDGAFSCCDCIKDLVLPDSITGIGNFAFESCEQLNSVYIPDSVTYIGKAVFAYSSLRTVRLSKNIKQLEASFDYEGDGEGFFAGSDLEKIFIPEGIEKIGYSTFSGCRNLKEVYIPVSVKEIEDYAFDNCNSLEKIMVTKGNMHYYSKEGVLYSFSGELLVYPANKKGDTFIAPEEVNEIHQHAFYENKHLKKLVLGDAISKIGYRAFACSNIESVNIPAKTERIELDIFLYCKVKELYIPKWVSFIEMNSNTAGNINPYKDMMLLVDKDSYAEKMCIEYKLKYLNIGE